MKWQREERFILTLMAIASASAFSIGLSQVLPILATNPLTVSHNILLSRKQKYQSKEKGKKNFRGYKISNI